MAVRSYLSSTWLIMSGYHQATPSIDLQSNRTDNKEYTETYETVSLKKVEEVIKFAIMCREPIAIHVNRSKSIWQVKLTFDKLGENSISEFATQHILLQQAGCGEYEPAKTRPLHQK